MEKLNRITLESLRKSSYFIIYDDFIQDKENNYPKLSIEAKVLYFKMRSRYQASIINNWIDIEKIPYLYFSLEEIMEFLNCANQKAQKLRNELINNNLIEVIRNGQGKPDKIYLFEYINPD